MAGINVFVAAPLPPALLQRLTSLDGGVEVVALTEAQRPLFRRGLSQDDRPEALELRRVLAGCEVALLATGTPPDFLIEAKRIRWVHTILAGVDTLLDAGFGRGDYVFTNGSGPHAIGISEYIVMQALVLSKRLPQYIRHQIDSKWSRVRPAPGEQGFELNGKTIGIVGLGEIGIAAAERLRSLGCRVIATRRSTEQREANMGPVEELLPAKDLPYLLGRSDIVVLSLALTSETHHLFDAKTLSQMKPSAFLINISRGQVIDEAALVEALQKGRIAGAALDVFETEPLPAESPLWGMENVVITPHTSAASENHQRRQVELFEENLRRYMAKEPLLNVVDADLGY